MGKCHPQIGLYAVVMLQNFGGLEFVRLLLQSFVRRSFVSIDVRRCSSSFLVAALLCWSQRRSANVRRKKEERAKVLLPHGTAKAANASRLASVIVVWGE